ncbi:PA0069 family radical SAM protein [Bordetella sp. FB-8]|uniref:PA0069 family radical SAM protein n=1 Tax=Bordetella sp. FB-8 TaxID=1159870 RepID=UPI0009D98252|nr:PA0069 family radical SAM protein [Bordetella sp. FB-8]
MANIDRSSFAVSAGSGSPATAPAALRGRGAVTNVGHRYQSDTRVEPLENEWAVEAADDCVGEEGDAAPAPLTQVRPEQVRTLLSRNDSPDIPFELAINPYRGCEHGCAYCYARPTHAYLGYSPGLDFETKLTAKVNAVSALRADLAKRSHRVSPINLGSATDIYQPIERQWRLTRGLLELMLETRHPVTLVTKNALVERDLDLLTALAERNLVMVYVSITTLDADMARTLEPRASAPWRRLQAVRTLTAAGVPVGVLAAPMIPFINDAFLEAILAEAAGAGARWGSYTVIRLPWEVHAVFEQWLRTHFPDRAERVLHRIEDLRGGRRNDPRFGTRMRGTGLWADLLRQRFSLAARKHGLNLTPRAQLDCQQFVPPVTRILSVRSTPTSPQLSLFV